MRRITQGFAVVGLVAIVWSIAMAPSIERPLAVILLLVATICWMLGMLFGAVTSDRGRR